MKEVTAWEDDEGNLHRYPSDVVIANLRALSKSNGVAPISIAAAKKLVAERARVIEILLDAEIDEECVPRYVKLHWLQEKTK